MSASVIDEGPPVLMALSYSGLGFVCCSDLRWIVELLQVPGLPLQRPGPQWCAGYRNHNAFSGLQPGEIQSNHPPATHRFLSGSGYAKTLFVLNVWMQYFDLFQGIRPRARVFVLRFPPPVPIVPVHGGLLRCCN